MSAGGLRAGEHKTWVDEQDIDHPEIIGKEPAFQAVCEDCDWCGRWQYVDTYNQTMSYPAASDRAHLEARREGLNHQDQTARDHQ